MKPERLEVRLRPNNSAEKELIEALDAQDGNHGGKSDLMRECLRIGYATLKNRMKNLSGQGDEIAALDALAQAFSSGEYGYRIVKTYLNAKNKHGSVAAKNQEAPHKMMDMEVTPLVSSTVASASDQLASTLDANQNSEYEEIKQENSSIIEVSIAAVDNPKKAVKAVDWSKMRGLAGSGDSK